MDEINEIIFCSVTAPDRSTGRGLGFYLFASTRRIVELVSGGAVGQAVERSGYRSIDVRCR